ncbi:MAG: hypothetical protein IPI69_03165 [Bacteroidales bacterium]|nr:hypothetical protein [Bacteroidales bacterium]
MFEYNFGTSKVYEINETDITSGRGGSLLLLFQPGKIGLQNAKEILFGQGIVDYALSSEGRFVGGKAYGIEHYGLLSSAVVIFIPLAFQDLFYGFDVTLYYFLIRTKRLLWIILILYMFELFFYGNQLFINHASAFIIIFSVFIIQIISSLGIRFCLSRSILHMNDKEKLLFINPHQFGHTAGYYYYCKYLRTEYNIKYLGFDEGLKKLVMPGTNVIYIQQKKNKILRILNFLYNSIRESYRCNYDILYVYSFYLSFIGLFAKKSRKILDIRTCSVSANPLKRRLINRLLSFNTLFLIE